LAVPDFMLSASSSAVTWLVAWKQPKATRPRRPSAPASVEALRQAKARGEGVRPAPSAALDETPHFARPSQPPLPPTTAARAQAAPSSHRPPARTATAAEILLARRRGRKP
jgi:hypothetical protein